MIRFLKFAFLALVIIPNHSCDNSSKKQLNSEASGFLLKASDIIASALRYGEVKTFPQRSSRGAQELDKFVGLYLISKSRDNTEKVAASRQRDDNSEKIYAPSFPKMAFSRFSKSGFLKTETADKQFTFMVLWRQSESALWDMRYIVVTIDGSKLSKLEEKTTRGVDSKWIDKNLLEFPYPGSVTGGTR